MNKTTIYNKLVRDNIPKIIEESGKQCETAVLNQEEYLKELDKKLSEEVLEYLTSHDIEEMADVLEVVDAIIKELGYSFQDVVKIKESKAKQRGKFEKRIYLKSVSDKKV